MYQKELLPKLFKQEGCDTCEESEDFEGIFESYEYEIKRYSDVSRQLIDTLASDFPGSKGLIEIKKDLDKVEGVFAEQSEALASLAIAVPDEWWIFQKVPAQETLPVIDEVFTAFAQENLYRDLGAELTEELSEVYREDYPNAEGDNVDVEAWITAVQEKLSPQTQQRLQLLNSLSGQIQVHVEALGKLGDFSTKLAFGQAQSGTKNELEMETNNNERGRNPHRIR